MGRGLTRSSGTCEMAAKGHKNGGRRGNPDIVELGKSTRFKKGKPGGPGRPKLSLLSAATKEWLGLTNEKTGKTNAELCVEAVGQAVVGKADVHAFNALSDRSEGKPRSNVHISGPSGGAIPIQIDSVKEKIAELTERIRARTSES